jgi:hypothetical protein
MFPMREILRDPAPTLLFGPITPTLERAASG